MTCCKDIGILELVFFLKKPFIKNCIIHMDCSIIKMVTPTNPSGSHISSTTKPPFLFMFIHKKNIEKYFTFFSKKYFTFIKKYFSFVKNIHIFVKKYIL